MVGGCRLSAVIPCYNERGGIVRVLAAAHPSIDEVIVVDNDSSDGSGDAARGLGATVVFEGRRGYGRAYKTGLAAAAGEIVGTLDGDGSYALADVVLLAESLLDGGLDFVSGCRFPLTSPRSMHPKNRAGNAVLSLCARRLLGVPLRDSQSGMWVFRRGILPRIMPRSDGMAFSEEIKLNAFLSPGLRCAERHIGYATREGRVKLHAFRDGLRNLRFLLKIRATRGRSER